ncbi:hypothetical protein RCL_jg14333.t1 [Rhizophagus clarus]|uniref:Uncharacterized protein n=1 Tax=Rhizophagus clarus TaxID=94130 RepID=A0A8H3LLC6_9GLOM|nr:hypothetical protein RCL_jg14333.t1 [Rhizophagus clarus]
MQKYWILLVTLCFAILVTSWIIYAYKEERSKAEERKSPYNYKSVYCFLVSYLKNAVTLFLQGRIRGRLPGSWKILNFTYLIQRISIAMGVTRCQQFGDTLERNDKTIDLDFTHKGSNVFEYKYALRKQVKPGDAHKVEKNKGNNNKF